MTTGSADRVWTYVVAINTATDQRPIADRLDLSEIGLHTAHRIHDWRAGCDTEATSIDVVLEPRDWALFVCCPIVEGAYDVGDTTKYVTVATQRTP